MRARARGRVLACVEEGLLVAITMWYVVCPPTHTHTPTHTCTPHTPHSMLALRDGRDPPTELPKPAPVAPRAASGRGLSAGSGPSSTSSGHGAPADSGGPPGESVYDREMRLRREAEERLRAKFGTGGLKGQSVSNSGGMGYTPPEASSGPE